MRWAVSVAQFLIANQHSFDYQPDHACNRVCSQETLMTLGRFLLVSLCSAASLTFVSGAQAADLPVKAKAVEICEGLLALRRGLLLHSGDGYLHQAWWLSAR